MYNWEITPWTDEEIIAELFAVQRELIDRLITAKKKNTQYEALIFDNSKQP